MNLYLSAFLFLLGLTFLLRPALTWIYHFWLGINSWQGAGQIVVILALIANLSILSIKNWMEYTGFVALFLLSFFALVTSFLVLIAESMMRRVVGFCVEHYWFIAIPKLIVLWTLGFWLFAWSYIGQVSEIENCVPDDKLEVLCNISDAEDLVATPDNRFLIAPEFGGIGPYSPPERRRTGRIMMVDLATEKAESAHREFGENVWGDRSCLRDAAMPFSPHGIDLKQRDDGLWHLAVINHFPKETLEMFELVQEKDKWKLIWRGCVSVPRVNYLNEVSLSSDGSFFVSHMYKPEFTLNEALVASLAKNNTGYVMRWDSEIGFAQVPGTEGAHPNGVTYDETRGILFVAHTFGDRIDAVDVLTGNIVSSFDVNSPDNLVLKDDALWITSWDHSIPDMVICEGKTPCALPFSIYKLEPNSLKPIKNWSFNHTIIGLPTVALPINGGVWIGAIHSDRLAYFRLENF